MNNRYLCIAILAFAINAVSSCNFLPEVEQVRLSATSLNLVVGSSSTLTATVLPEAAEYEAIMWKSSDPSVASVSGGTVTGLKVGKVNITATAEGVKSLPCEVNVMAIHVTGVSLNKTSVVLTEGETFTLTPTVSPSNATDRSVKWSTSDYSVASVSSDGLVTAKVPGTSTITVMSNDGGKTASCQVTVNPKVISVTGVTLSQSTLSLTEGETSQLQATVSPSNATNMEVKWSSSNTSVATVDSNGKVTAKSAGTATITARTTDQGKTATCSVTVKALVIQVNDLVLSQSTASVIIGKTVALVATVKPDNATNKRVSWSSSNPNIARVANDGTVTGIAEGSATITCTTEDGAIKRLCYITVVKSTATYTMDNLTLLVGSSYLYDDSTLNKMKKPFKWESSDTSVATVDNNGLVTGLSAGTAKITCTSSDGSKGVFTVTVNSLISFIPQNNNTGRGFILKSIRFQMLTCNSIDRQDESWIANSNLYYRISIPVVLQYAVSLPNLSLDNQWDYSFIFKDVSTRSGRADNFSMNPSFQSYSNGILSLKVNIRGDEAYDDLLTYFALRISKNGVSYTSDYANFYRAHKYYYPILNGLRTINQVWTSNIDRASCSATVSINGSLDLKAMVSSINYSYGNLSLTIDKNEMAEAGLSIVFELVKNYKVGAPAVDQANYVTLVNGVLYPRSPGTNINEAIGHTPIIRVKLYQNNNVIDVRYLKVYISS